MTGEFPEWLVKFEHWLEYEVTPRIESTLEAVRELKEMQEPEKPDIQCVAEWLGVDLPGYQNLDDVPGYIWPLLAEGGFCDTRDAFFWRIEERLIRAKEARLYWSDLFAKDTCRLTVAHKAFQRPFEASTRGEALLEAAKWLMEQEGSDGRC